MHVDNRETNRALVIVSSQESPHGLIVCRVFITVSESISDSCLVEVTLNLGAPSTTSSSVHNNLGISRGSLGLFQSLHSLSLFLFRSRLSTLTLIIVAECNISNLIILGVFSEVNSNALEGGIGNLSSGRPFSVSIVTVEMTDLETRVTSVEQ